MPSSVRFLSLKPLAIIFVMVLHHNWSVKFIQSILPPPRPLQLGQKSDVWRNCIKKKFHSKQWYPSTDLFKSFNLHCRKLQPSRLLTNYLSFPWSNRRAKNRNSSLHQILLSNTVFLKVAPMHVFFSECFTYHQGLPIIAFFRALDPGKSSRIEWVKQAE